MVTRDLATPEAICFDLDGTLYSQAPLRRLMIARLVSAHLTKPREALKTLRIISAYRKAQEALRGGLPCDLAQAQVDLTCRWTGFEPDPVRRSTAVWFDQEPLPFLARFIRPGLKDFLRSARTHGIKLSVLSDYPAEAKLTAMGLREFFDLVVAAQDPDIGCFKPSPIGLNSVIARLGVDKTRILYVGDRTEVDGEVARRAGIQAVIIGPNRQPDDHGCIHIRTFTEFRTLLGL